jgi:hypothetical protein
VTIASRPFVGRDQIAVFLFLPSRQLKLLKIRNRFWSHLIRPIDLVSWGSRETHSSRAGSAQSEEQRNRSRHCPIAIVAVNDGGTVAGRFTRPLAAGPVAQWLEPAAHNGLVAGSSPAGPTNEINDFSSAPYFSIRQKSSQERPFLLARRLPCL